ncbi:MAG: hypothetical protein ACYTXA_00090 [Nostoc sp.]
MGEDITDMAFRVIGVCQLVWRQCDRPFAHPMLQGDRLSKGLPNKKIYNYLLWGGHLARP